MTKIAVNLQKDYIYVVTTLPRSRLEYAGYLITCGSGGPKKFLENGILSGYDKKLIFKSSRFMGIPKGWTLYPMKKSSPSYLRLIKNMRGKSWELLYNCSFTQIRIKFIRNLWYSDKSGIT